MLKFLKKLLITPLNVHGCYGLRSTPQPVPLVYPLPGAFTQRVGRAIRADLALQPPIVCTLHKYAEE